MPELLDRVIVEILGDDSKLKQALDRAERSTSRAAGQIERSLEKANRRVLSFGDALSGLSRILGPAIAGLGAYGLARAAFNWSASANKAEIATRLFRKQLERMGQDAEAGTAKLEAVAERLGVLPQDLAEYSTQLLRQGLTMDEIATLFEGAAASALVAGKSTKEGIDAVTNAVVTQQSIYLNYAGIAENLNQAYKEMAKTLGKSVEALTKEEKARAAVNLVMQATKEEVRDLDQLLGGLPGKQNALNKEWAEFRQELGERLIPAVSELIEVATAGLRALNSLFDWLDHVFGDKVKLAARDARDEIRAVKRELGEARSADELIDKMKALSDTLSGPGKKAWQEYVAEAEKSKESIKDISKAATEAIVKFLAVSSVTQEQTVAKAKDALMTAIERSGLSRDIVEYLKKAAERGGDVFAGTLAQVRKELSEQVSRISGGTEAAQLQRQRLLNQIELLNHLEGAVVPLRKAEAELAATQEEQARIIKVLNGEVDTLRSGLSGSGSGSAGGSSGGLAGDADKAAVAFDRLTQSVINFTNARRGIGAYGGTQALLGLGLDASGATVAPRGSTPPTAGGAPLYDNLADFDVAAREAAQAAEELTDAQREAVRRLYEAYRSLGLSAGQAGVNRLGLTPPPEEPTYNVIQGSGSSSYGASHEPGLGRRGAIVAPREGSDIAGGARLDYNLADFDVAAREAGKEAEERRKSTEWLGKFAEGLQGALGALNPFGAILEAINPLGTIIQSMLEELGPVLEPIIGIFKEIGRLLGRILQPILKALTPILKALEPAFRALGTVVAWLWNAIATVVNMLFGWAGVHLDKIDLNEPSDTTTPEPVEKPTWSGWGDATNPTATIGVEAAPTPVVATPSWVHTFGSHVDRFGQYVARLVEEGISVRCGGTTQAAGGGVGRGLIDRVLAGSV